MSDKGHKVYSYERFKILEYNARIEAITARIAAMQTENAVRERLGEAFAYYPESFFAAEQEIEGWANAIMHLAESIAPVMETKRDDKEKKK